MPAGMVAQTASPADFQAHFSVEDAAGVMPIALRLGRPRIIGLSQGGSTVLRLAATYPELVHSFIFEGVEAKKSQSGAFRELGGLPGLVSTPGLPGLNNSGRRATRSA